MSHGFRSYMVYGLVLMLALLVGLWLGFSRREAAPEPPEGVFWPNPKQLDHFALYDQHGAAFTEASLQGRWTLLFFGYTHCPDVCPVTLAVLKAVKTAYAQAQSADKAAAEDAELKIPYAGSMPIQYVFVTVDPERDTRAHLWEYLSYFDPAFIGLHGSERALAALYAQLGVLVVKGEPDREGNYLVDHTAGILLLDPKARLVAIFQAPHEPQSLRTRLDEIRAFLDRVESWE